MRAMRVLLYLVAAVALAVTVQLPTARGHEAAHHHGHHGHHHDEHEHDGHAHGHHGHKHVEEAHAHEHQHHDHHHRGHNHVKEAHGHEHDHHDHDHHDHKHVEEAHAHGHDHHEHHGHHHHEHHDHHHDHKKTPASRGAAGQAIDRFSPRVWAEALFATALVGAAPVVVLLFVPLGRGSAEAQKPLLRVFLSFAAGGLMGDALLHLLPHSLPSGGHAHGHHGHDHHGHDHDHAHAHSLADLAVWLYCLAGMMAFLMLEKFVRAQTGDGHGHAHGHTHGHSHGPRTAPQEENPTPDGLRRRNVAGKKKLSDDEAPAAKTTAEESKPRSEPARISAAGYLNLAADFSHNFTDGLAIGATFLRGSGWQTTVAMLLHEVPHEIGDFAILIQSGFTRRQAMLTQLGTALGAMAGTVLGLLIEGAGDSGSAWISPFTAGGFIYIACASVMPELLEDCSLKQSLQEGVAMCLGIGLMVVIALYE